MKQFTA
jgi:catechol-2,3-dioxygenase